MPFPLRVLLPTDGRAAGTGAFAGGLQPLSIAVRRGSNSTPHTVTTTSTWRRDLIYRAFSGSSWTTTSVKRATEAVSDKLVSVNQARGSSEDPIKAIARPIRITPGVASHA